MPELALITVHGMGETPRDYAAGVFGAMRTRLGAALRKRAALYSVYYQDILQKNEQLVWDRVDGASKVHFDSLRKFMLFGFADAAGLENRKEDPDSVYALAQGQIARALLAACAANPDDVLGWPLQPLSEGQRTLAEDRVINAGQGAVGWMLKSWNPLSHNSYWQDEEVLAPLAGMSRRMMS